MGDRVQSARQVPALSGISALFLDIDGTLLDIAPTPTSVVVPDTLRHDLQQARRALNGAVALVSGGAIADIDRLFAPLRLAASGQHGAELRLDPYGSIEVVAAAD